MFPDIEGQPVKGRPSGTDRVLMLAPFRRQQRGNAITVARLYQGLLKQGCLIDVISLEDETCWDLIENACDQNRYRFVHGFNAFYTAQAFKRVPHLAELPLLLTTTGTDLHYGLRGPKAQYLRNIIIKADFTVVFNQEFKSLLRFVPGFEQRVISIPQGVWLEAAEPGFRSQFGLNAGDIVFVLPSGLRPVKNLELAVDGLALIKPELPNLRLLIMGAPLEQSYAEGFLTKIADIPWIKYLGEIPHRQMGSLYLLGDVVVNSSLTEGQPQAALEAMSLARPALLSAVPGNLGIIEHGGEGYYFSSPEDLAGYALRLARAPAERMIMGENARNLTNRCFSLAAEVDAYKHLYSIMFQN